MQLTSQPKIAPVPSGYNRPFWSVMIPTYNCADYLVETLKSVLQQDPGLEHMQIEVIDDCSPKDDPEQVVKEIGKGRVKFYRQPKNGGAINNFNTCIQRSKGHWVHILHGDDTVLPGFYSHFQTAFEQNHGLGAGFCRNVYFDENSVWQSLAPLERETPGVHLDYINRLAVINFITTPSIVVRRKVYEMTGGFDIRLPHCADWEMWKRVGINYPVWYEPKVLACYREHSGSDTSRLRRTGGNILDGRESIQTFHSYLPKNEQAERLKQLALDEHAGYAHATSHKMLAYGDIDAAMAQVEEGIKCSCLPFLIRTQQEISLATEISSNDDHNTVEQSTELIDRQIQYHLDRLTTNPKNVDAHTRLSKLYYQQGKLESSLTHSKKAISIKPNASAYQTLGDVMKEMGNLVAASCLYARALEFLAYPQEQWAKIHSSLGDIYAKQGRWQQAIEEYTSALGAKPNLGEVYWNLHQVWNELNKPKEAAACLYRFFILKPQRVTGVDDYLNLGRSLLTFGRLSEAVDCYHKAIAINPNLAEAHLNLGRALAQQQELELAVSHYQTALELSPNLSESYLELGKVLVQQQELERAIACYQRVIELDSEKLEAYHQLAKLLIKQSRWEEAIPYYQAAIKLNSDPLETYQWCHNLADALIKQGKIDKALTFYLQALEYHSEDIQIFYKVIQIKPDYWDIYLKLGKHLVNQNSLDEAIAIYQTALNLNPNHQEIFSELSSLLQQKYIDEAIIMSIPSMRKSTIS